MFQKKPKTPVTPFKTEVYEQVHCEDIAVFENKVQIFFL